MYTNISYANKDIWISPFDVGSPLTSLPSSLIALCKTWDTMLNIFILSLILVQMLQVFFFFLIYVGVDSGLPVYCLYDVGICPLFP